MKKQGFDENGPSNPKLVNMKLSWKFFLVFYLLSISSRWHESVAYGALFIPVTTGSLLGASFVMPTIFWDPRNPMYVCHSTSFKAVNL